MMKLKILMVLVLLSAYAAISQAETVTMLQDLEGEPKTLTQFTGNGKWLVVMLWASDCHVCNQEAHNYDTFHRAHMSSDATILGVSADGWDQRQDADDFIKRHKVTFPNLIGSPQAVASLYSNLTGEGWRGTPTFLVFAPDGELKAQQVGAVPTSILDEFIRRESRTSATGG